MLLSPSPCASFRLRVAIRVRGGVAAIQPHLVCAQPVELDEEPLIKFHSALRVHIELHHPTLQSIRVELLVPRGVERIGEIDALAVAADLDHLWATVKRLVRFARVSRPAHEAAKMDRASLLRMERVGHIVLNELPCPPARNIEKTIIERQVDISYEGWCRLEAC